MRVEALVPIQYKGKPYGPSGDPFEMDDKTAKELIRDGIVKAAAESAKPKSSTKTEE
jgi:hypothetical protein